MRNIWVFYITRQADNNMMLSISEVNNYRKYKIRPRGCAFKLNVVFLLRTANKYHDLATDFKWFQH